MKTQAVVTLSGGLDSAVALAASSPEFDVQKAYFVNYGQKAGRMELGCAMHLARHYHVDFEMISLPVIGSPMTNEVAPEEALASNLEQDPSTVEPLYVPMRNLLILTHVAARAYGLGVHNIITGNTPSKSYPDTGIAYLKEVEAILERSSWQSYYIHALLIELEKSKIVQLGDSLHVPFHLTWSCLLSQTSVPCGRCRACMQRAKAFKESGLVDPILKQEA